MAVQHIAAYDPLTNRIGVPQGADEYVIAKVLNLSADIVTSGDIDGRTVSADGSKLDLLTLTGAFNLDAAKVKVDHITVTQAVDLDTMESRINALSAAVVLMGVWDASAGPFPTSTVAGESWIVSVAGTVGGIPFALNDRIVAIVDGASTSVYAGNWHKLDYTDEVLSVAGRTGAVVLVEGDITDLQSYLLATDIDSRAKLNAIVGETLMTVELLDTLSELNALFTDGTVLIDTTDARLSDARTPLSHTHTHPMTKSYNFSSRTAASGIYYLAGYYTGPAADLSLTDAGPTGTHGSANASYAAHAYMVFGAGSTDGTNITITVTGTSITDAGVRTAADSQILYSGTVAALSVDQYIETTKKWIGQITYTLTSDGVNFTCDFNYGLAKYDDMMNTNFTLQGCEFVGLADANDNALDIEVIYHSVAGWTYSAAAFVPGATPLAQMSVDHSTEREAVAGECIAYKRDNLNQGVSGSTVEGVVIRVTTGTNNSIKYLNAHLIVDQTI